MKKILVFLLLVGMAAAYQTDFQVFDINTLQPIGNATITVYDNESVEYNSSTTNDYGFLSLGTLADVNNTYSYLAQKNAYHNLLGSTTVDGTEILLLYMYPISSDGIVYLVGNDLTFNEHDFSVFYKENGRLHGTYHSNDTIKLLINREYVIKPRITKLDIVSSPKGIGFYGLNFMYPLFGLMFLAFIAVIILLIIVILYRRLSKK